MRMEESDEIPSATKREFHNMSKKMRDLGQIIVDEMNDYRRSINLLHDENRKIVGQLVVVPQRQEIQVQQQELHSQYISQLLAHYHGASFSHLGPPPPPHPPVKFPYWHASTPPRPTFTTSEIKLDSKSEDFKATSTLLQMGVFCFLILFIQH